MSRRVGTHPPTPPHRPQIEKSQLEILRSRVHWPYRAPIRQPVDFTLPIHAVGDFYGTAGLQITNFPGSAGPIVVKIGNEEYRIDIGDTKTIILKSGEIPHCTVLGPGVDTPATVTFEEEGLYRILFSVGRVEGGYIRELVPDDTLFVYTYASPRFSKPEHRKKITHAPRKPTAVPRHRFRVREVVKYALPSIAIVGTAAYGLHKVMRHLV